MNVECFLSRYSTVFHMAEAGSWPRIRRDGLLSTTALLDLYRVTGERRHRLEASRRSKSEHLIHPDTGETAVLRDNRAMNDHVLDDLLPSDMQPAEWYRLLNRHVFFWVNPASLTQFLGAYGKSEHDVITVDTRRLVQRDYNRITITPMNTGSASRRTELARGRDIFAPRIDEFDLEGWDLLTSKRRDTIVELAVDYAVMDIEEVTVRVERRTRSELLKSLWQQTTLAT